MARDLGSYNEEIVWEFYPSYVSNLRGSIDMWEKPANQDPLNSTLVRDYSINILEFTIHLFLYIPTTSLQWRRNTLEFYYRFEIVRSGEFLICPEN